MAIGYDYGNSNWRCLEDSWAEAERLLGVPEHLTVAVLERDQ
jgi:hypothetical protein